MMGYFTMGPVPKNGCEHRWVKPRAATERRKRDLVRVYFTRCRDCGIYAVRDTLAQLKAEVMA